MRMRKIKARSSNDSYDATKQTDKISFKRRVICK